MLELFWKECRQLCRSVLFWLYILLILLMYLSQLGVDANSIDHPLEPQPGQASYGSKTAENPDTIMPMSVQNLLSEYAFNNYVCYPFGFYRNTRLDEEGRAKIAAILRELTGEEIPLPADDDGGASPGITIGEDGIAVKGGEGGFTIRHPDGTVSEYQKGEVPGEFKAELESGGLSTERTPAGKEITVQVDYDRFLELMSQVDGLLGGGSSYSRAGLISQFGFVPKTYEDALAEYRNFMEQDRVLGAFARLFADYVGIPAAVLPAFVAVSLFLRDRRARMQELAYSRRISSAGIVSARFSALAVMLILPLLLLSLLPLFQLLPNWMGKGVPLDYFAYGKYILGWLAPSVLVSAAVGGFFTVLTDTPLGLLAQGIWWFFDLFTGFGPQDISWFRLAVRHNSMTRYDDFAAAAGTIAWNRAGITLLALALILLTAGVYEQKRRGKLNAGSKISRLAARFRGKR